MTAFRTPPTGAHHDVGPEEIFFSTTDARGVILQSNDVFVRLSRYPRERLIGAPHNIIRHPAMPAGAFLLMWDTLTAGRPFCAYVDNLAADGSCYTVFATITPLGDRYLSVRFRPLRTDLLGAARSLYAAVRPGELEQRALGLSAHAAAEHGLGQLASLLAGAGFPSYEEFIWTALPAEVMARANAGVGYPDRTDSASEWWPLLAAGARVHRALTSWVGQLDTLQELADALVAGGQRVRAGITASEQAAGDLTAAASATSGFSPVMASLTLWVAMTAEMDEMLRALADRLAELRTGVARTRFGIALGSLESETVGRFVSELMDGGPGARDAQPAIRDLVVALRKGVTQASAETAANAALAASVADEVQALAELLGVPTTLLAGFEATRSSRSRTAS
jgi:aerotaxis receptor